MGTQYSSDIQVRRITEGTQFHFLSSTNPITKLIMKLFVIAAACLAATVSAEADADAYYGYGYLHYLGKRSAEPYYGYPHFFPYALSAGPLATAAGPTGIAGHGTGTSYVARSPQGVRGKRSAEPYFGYGFYGYRPFGYGPGIAGHPGAATSYVARSPQGLGK